VPNAILFIVPRGVRKLTGKCTSISVSYYKREEREERDGEKREELKCYILYSLTCKKVICG
jgi:hypothetical protein